MRRSSLPNAATGVADVDASTSKPSGAFETWSPWLIQTFCAAGCPREQHAAVAGERGIRRSVFAQAGVGDLAAERLRHDLEAVADAECRDAEVEDAGVERRRAGLVDRRRSAREDEADGVLAPRSRRPSRCAARSRCRRRLRARGARSAARTARRSRRPGRGAGRSRSVRSPLCSPSGMVWVRDECVGERVQLGALAGLAGRRARRGRRAPRGRTTGAGRCRPRRAAGSARTASA